MDFFQILFSPGPQVGNYEANGQVWLKNSDSKWPKKLRQNGSSVDDSRSSRVKSVGMPWPKKKFFRVYCWIG